MPTLGTPHPSRPVPWRGSVGMPRRLPEGRPPADDDSAWLQRTTRTYIVSINPSRYIRTAARTRISQIAIAYIFSSISDPAWPSEQSVRRKRVINIIIIPTMPSHRRENTQSGSTPSSLRTPPYRPGNTRHAYNTPAVYAGSAPRGLSKPRRSVAGLNVQAMAARQRGSTT